MVNASRIHSRYTNIRKPSMVVAKKNSAIIIPAGDIDGSDRRGWVIFGSSNSAMFDI
jgi:hypothetical protein